MPNAENLKPPIKKGEVRNPNGRPAGKPNRSTVAKKILSLLSKKALPEEIKAKLKEEYPAIKDSLTLEEVMTLVIVNKCITDNDVQAYKAIMDSAHGLPKQEIDNSHSFKNLPEWIDDESQP